MNFSLGSFQRCLLTGPGPKRKINAIGGGVGFGGSICFR